MKKIKKLIALAVATLMATSITACTSSNADNDSNVKEAAVYSADVIIIGAGGAGMTAAIEAVDTGASVIMLEKSSSVGGNTLATQSGMTGAVSKWQEEAGVEITLEEFVEMQTNDYANPELVEYFTNNTVPTLEWLESQGMDFDLNSRNELSHISADGQTTALAVVDILYSGLKDREVNIQFNTTATELVEENGVVRGVIATNADGESIVFNANAVVLATGGYGQNSEMVYEYAPELTGAITDEIAPTTGDGIIMAEALGAATTDLDKFTTFPAVEAKTHQMIFPMNVPQDVIYVNREGNRFVSEVWDSEDTNNAILENGTVFVVFDQARMDSASGFQELYKRGAVYEGATIEELANEIGVSVENLTATIEQWNVDVEAGLDSVFGRDSKMDNGIETAPYYAVEMGVGVHYCLGGLVINTDAQVINNEGEVITGLYAAGEVTGGLHGDRKVDGSTFSDSIVFGRQSGIQAATFALAQGTMEYVAPTVEKQEVVIEGEGNFTNGVYEGTGAGRNGDVKVQVTVDGGNITEILMVEHEETESIFQGVVDNLIPAIITTQSVNVDVISGATLSSEAVLEAVSNALGL